ncbi:AraC family transcriptional regulator [Halopseudomonas nanhaiensis]|uniref:AraC family transcriptional regulator n=1 Tax=Halopseudomonas nanhaiensis TaxID=2830842 RepID=UPI001CC0E6E0|nr:AraC family transcriptional regulator [Halopseudomonas nanhaiensis]UAW97321.1 AraC family transcriptional regulator [Halopseudomonas nanhaiensis]
MVRLLAFDCLATLSNDRWTKGVNKIGFRCRESEMDAVSTLLSRFKVNSRTFFSGPLCGETADYGHDRTGHVHIIHHGEVVLEVRGSVYARFIGPAVVLFPRAVPHRLRPAAQPARISCARLEANRFEEHPLMRLLSEVVVLEGEAHRTTATVIDLLEVEAESALPGRRTTMDRLFDLVLIGLLRHEIATPHAHASLLQGLAHPALARALAAVHEHPERRWTLPTLAAEACMSRSTFAETFQRLLGCTPLAYLRQWRIGLVQQGLRNGIAFAVLVDQVGYDDASALRRAFRKATGCTPGEWLRTHGTADW